MEHVLGLLPLLVIALAMIALRVNPLTLYRFFKEN